nr:hypothetical protein [uncultured Methanoregula sp.]
MQLNTSDEGWRKRGPAAVEKFMPVTKIPDNHCLNQEKEKNSIASQIRTAVTG